MMTSGMVRDVLTGEAGEAVQEERKIKSNRKKAGSVRISIFECDDDFLPRFVYWIACWSSSKEVIQEILLMKSASEALCSRRARTAGPTGSSPAAPPGASA